MTDTNRLSQWTISDYFRDSFVLTKLDSQPGHIASQYDHGETNEIGGDSVIFRLSRYDDLFNTETTQNPRDFVSPMTRNQRWSEETEDVPDRYQPYGKSARGTSFGVGRSHRWSEETEDVPYRYPDFARF